LSVLTLQNYQEKGLAANIFYLTLSLWWGLNSFKLLDFIANSSKLPVKMNKYLRSERIFK